MGDKIGLPLDTREGVAGRWARGATAKTHADTPVAVGIVKADLHRQRAAFFTQHLVMAGIKCFNLFTQPCVKHIIVRGHRCK